MTPSTPGHKPSTSPRPLTLAELAERWGCEPETAMDRVREQGVPFVWLDKGEPRLDPDCLDAIRFRLESIERWEAEREHVWSDRPKKARAEPETRSVRIEGPILTPEDLSARWGISTEVIRRMIRDGRLKHIPISEGARKYSRGPTQYRFRIEDILAFEANEAGWRIPPTAPSEVSTTRSKASKVPLQLEYRSGMGKPADQLPSSPAKPYQYRARGGYRACRG